MRVSFFVYRCSRCFTMFLRYFTEIATLCEASLCSPSFHNVSRALLGLIRFNFVIMFYNVPWYAPLLCEISWDSTRFYGDSLCFTRVYEWQHLTLFYIAFTIFRNALLHTFHYISQYVTRSPISPNTGRSRKVVWLKSSMGFPSRSAELRWNPRVLAMKSSMGFSICTGNSKTQ